MITLQDLDKAIKECEGQRNPNAGTALKLAAFYTIKKELYPTDRPTEPGYSYAAEPETEYESTTEFGDAVRGKKPAAVMQIMDELMTVLRSAQPRLHRRIIDEINNI